jgi:hypothetical protein
MCFRPHHMSRHADYRGCSFLCAFRLLVSRISDQMIISPTILTTHYPSSALPASTARSDSPNVLSGITSSACPGKGTGLSGATSTLEIDERVGVWMDFWARRVQGVDR